MNSKKETDKDHDALVNQLKDLQQQLLNQEKMASIGLLAAGIAHEIKNPLNFINNFSEMTLDLLAELKTQIQAQNLKAESLQAINEIIEDIANNCKKINEHGKRANSIIQNMLIQARTQEVETTDIDINALLEEFMSLSYQGMRAQNNKFNVKIEKNFNKQLKPIKANIQSMGRVFLNIINNAIYATNEKAEQIKKEYMPTISLSTDEDDNFVIVKIKDNGNGIPENIRSKIFEPFFTTKPAGEGTGLGLPLCYDIVVKEHKGKLDVVSTPGKSTEFIIMLPKNLKE